MAVSVGKEEADLKAELEEVGMLSMEAEGEQREGLSKPRKDRTSLESGSSFSRIATYIPKKPGNGSEFVSDRFLAGPLEEKRPLAL